MARETKKQMQQRLEEANQADWDSLRQVWSRRVLNAVLTAVHLSDTFQVCKSEDGVWFDTSRSSDARLDFYGVEVVAELPVEPTWQLLYDLEVFEAAVATHYRLVQEGVDLLNKKSAALSKLTKEERTLLGLT